MFNDNNINWMGNNVVNPSAPRQPFYPPAQEMPPMDLTPEMPQEMPQEMPMETPQERRQETPQERRQERTPVEDEFMDERMMRQGPPPVTDIMYIPGYLMSIIGKRVRAEFSVGNNLYIDKSGILRTVGVNYFVLEDNVSHAMIMCDLYSVRFVTSL